MRKPWEETGSHREFGSDRARRMDRREDRGQFERRSDRREDGFGRREGGFERREDRRSFGDRRFDRDSNRSFTRRPTRRAGMSGQRQDRQENLFGVRSGPRARAAVLNRRESNRAFDTTNASRNALVTLDADVARVFGSSEVVNAALRQLIALAQLMGPQALSQAAKEEVVEPMATEDKNETVLINDESAATEVVSENSQTDEEEEWFEIPVEAK